MSRDMTKAQFEKALHRHGMKIGFFGYVNVTESTSVCRFNAGNRRRDQLRYLLREQGRAKSRGL